MTNAKVTLTIPAEVPEGLLDSVTPAQLETLAASMVASMPTSIPLSPTDPSMIVVLVDPKKTAKAQIESES